ncbi:YdcF family protein [Gryllotalpicola koreensis]|uniref:YdcF family protein n=1 Tax=Gryllotalpicola koreensis TaxID=993086 RepID=A0ABP7ZPI5_9MICO
MLDELETTRPAPTRGRIVARWVAAALAFLVVIGLAGLPLYVFPRTDKPVKADAVVVLGPGTPQRVDLGTRLVAEGYASHLYVSTPASMRDYAPCFNIDTTCFTPSPTTTRGEARFTLDEARAHGWSRVIVITGDFHVSRARFIFDRCSGVDPVMLGTDEERTAFGWVYQYAYQSAGFVKAVIVGCAKS